MNLANLAENTGNSFLMSVLSGFFLNAMKKRSLKSKIVGAIRNGGNNAKGTLLHSTAALGFEEYFRKTPSVFFASFLSGTVFGNKSTLYKNLNNGIFAGANSYIFDRYFKR
ncbi:hypothetical protein GVAV_002051 [Gurleya vavrai]